MHHPHHHPFVTLAANIRSGSGTVPPIWALYACPICITPIPDPDLEKVLDFTKKIGDTVSQIGTTLTEIGLIAMEDNPEVGAAIMKKLQGQVASGSKVMAQYAGQSGTSAGRSKRAAMMDGSSALDMVGDSLAKVGGMISADMKKLSKRAQDKINKKNKDALDSCRADSCKAASKLLEEDGERQK